MTQRNVRTRSLHHASYRIFVDQLAELRRDAAISQQELARRLGKPQSFVSKYERGERRLDVPEFIRIVRALGGDPAKLLRHIEKAIGD